MESFFWVWRQYTASQGRRLSPSLYGWCFTTRTKLHTFSRSVTSRYRMKNQTTRKSDMVIFPTARLALSRSQSATSRSPALLLGRLIKMVHVVEGTSSPTSLSQIQPCQLHQQSIHLTFLVKVILSDNIVTVSRNIKPMSVHQTSLDFLTIVTKTRWWANPFKENIGDKM